MPPFIISSLSKNKRKVKVAYDKREAFSTKINKIVSQGYIEPGQVENLIHFFDMPKGESDIYMVYDGSACGLNKAL